MAIDGKSSEDEVISFMSVIMSFLLVKKKVSSCTVYVMYCMCIFDQLREEIEERERER